jgi:hypothetical protein
MVFATFILEKGNLFDIYNIISLKGLTVLINIIALKWI